LTRAYAGALGVFGLWGEMRRILTGGLPVLLLSPLVTRGKTPLLADTVQSTPVQTAAQALSSSDDLLMLQT
jgi:hypothetical protein